MDDKAKEENDKKIQKLLEKIDQVSPRMREELRNEIERIQRSNQEMEHRFQERQNQALRDIQVEQRQQFEKFNEALNRGRKTEVRADQSKEIRNITTQLERISAQSRTSLDEGAKIQLRLELYRIRGAADALLNTVTDPEARDAVSLLISRAQDILAKLNAPTEPPPAYQAPSGKLPLRERIFGSPKKVPNARKEEDEDSYVPPGTPITPNSKAEQVIRNAGGMSEEEASRALIAQAEALGVGVGGGGSAGGITYNLVGQIGTKGYAKSERGRPPGKNEREYKHKIYQGSDGKHYQSKIFTDGSEGAKNEIREHELERFGIMDPNVDIDDVV